jgi:predicted transcriptional regulator
MAGAHILACLTHEGKTIEQIAKEDFDNNMELVTVWADYITAANWMYKDTSNGVKKWTATDNGKKWLEKYYNTKNE